MKKYFCDKCGKELDAEELRFSLEMTGKELCSEHAREITDKKVKWALKPKNWFEKKIKIPKLPGTFVANGKHYAKDDGSGFIYPVD